MSDHDESMHLNADDAASKRETDSELESGPLDAMLPEEFADQDEILILEQDLDPQFSEEGEVLVSAPDEDPGELVAVGGEPTVLAAVPTRRGKSRAEDGPDAEVTHGDVQNMVVEMPGRSRRRLMVYAAALLIAGLAGATYYYTIHRKDAGAIIPARSGAVAAKKPRPKPAPPPTDGADDTEPVASAQPDDGNPEPATPVPTEDGSTDPEDTTTEPPAVDPPVSPPPSTPEPAEVTPPASSDTAPGEPRPRPAPTAHSQEALHELVNLALVEGFGRLKPPGEDAIKGIRVRLRGGKEVILAPGESLVELKNGNHFKGNIVKVGEHHLTMAFPYGTIRIPKQDLNQVVPSGDAGDQPLDQYRTGIVRLRNGNRLTGKILKVSEDRVVLGFTSAQIVIPRTAMVESEDALEYTEADRPKQYFGVGRGYDTAAKTGNPKVESFLGVPYYDFVNGFSFVPPRGWQKFAKDAIIGFDAPADSKTQATLNLGGLYIEPAALQRGLESLRESLPDALKNLQVIDGVKETASQNLPWNFQIDCSVAVPRKEGAKEGAAAEQKLPAKRARLYVFSRFGRVFIMSIFAMDKDFDKLQSAFDQCAKTFDYKN